MNLIFFPLIGLGPFAMRVELGIKPALLSLFMVLTYSVVLGIVYMALDKWDVGQLHTSFSAGPLRFRLSNSDWIVRRT
jgi:hypothetical protein